jgi:hypothetical protein
VLVDLATLLCVNFGRQEEGIARGQEALALARRLGSTRLEAMAGRALGNLYVRGNAIGEGVTLIERALVLAHAGDDPVVTIDITGANVWAKHV